MPNKWVIIGITALILVLLTIYSYNKTYKNGYKAGVEATELAHNVEKLKWIAKVSELQQQHEDTVNGILTSYNGLVAEYEIEIEKLKSQDPVIRTRYIHKYVPVETLCDITKGFVDLHNTAAQGKPLSENPVDPNSPTNIKLTDVASTVAVNYYTYNKVVTQLKALQQVVIEFQNRQKELME
jgi:hypothetical protein